MWTLLIKTVLRRLSDETGRVSPYVMRCREISGNRSRARWTTRVWLDSTTLTACGVDRIGELYWQRCRVGREILPVYTPPFKGCLRKFGYSATLAAKLIIKLDLTWNCLLLFCVKILLWVDLKQRLRSPGQWKLNKEVVQNKTASGPQPNVLLWSGLTGLTGLMDGRPWMQVPLLISKA